MKCQSCGTEWTISIHGNSVQKFCPVCGNPVFEAPARQLATLEETLYVIRRDYGMEHLRDNTRIIAYFSDLAPHLRKERTMLQHLIQCNGNTVLLAALEKSPREQQLCIRQLSAKMVEDLFLSEAAAQMICNSFWNAITAGGETAPKAPNPMPPVSPPQQTAAPTPKALFEDSCVWESRDITKALTLLIRAAEAGYLPAQNKLAKWYRDGKTVKKDPLKAFRWYREAALAGDPDAQCNLGWCYATGFGCDPRPMSAAYYFRKASDAGVTAAHYNLAKCYAQGNGVEKDLKQAAELYGRAAKAGYVKAQYRYGECLELGRGLRKDVLLAVFWYKKAGNNGSADAQYAMGRCYEQGIGYSADPDIAYYWYKKAGDNGHPEGKKKVALADRK